MVHNKWSVEMATAGAMSMESGMSAPPVNDDGSSNLSDPDLQNKIDLQSLLAE
jgi:hypothetical protein